MKALPLCEYLGDSTSPPDGETPAKSWHKCAKAHGKQGKVCKCNCGPGKCKDYRANSEYVADFRWISTRKLVEDTISLIGSFPANVGGIAAIPRSGLIPASILANYLHVPLYQITQDGKFNRLGHGLRGEAFGFANASNGSLVVIDDTVYSGRAINQVRTHLTKKGVKALYAAVYVRPEVSHLVDIFSDYLASPHLLEWNWNNSIVMTGQSIDPVYGAGIASDFDGVICENPTVPDADGGPGLEAYRRWVSAARPLMLPRANPIPLIITARLERFRKETESWLVKHGVKWNRLEMNPASKASERGDVSRWKAQLYKASGCGFYIESEPEAARAIFQHCKCPVVCPRSEEVFHV
jgi:adenine/guanine phosphoribosyltransferase-like PRPP-binding protein